MIAPSARGQGSAGAAGHEYRGGNEAGADDNDYCLLVHLTGLPSTKRPRHHPAAARCTPAEAEPLYKRALAIKEKDLGPEHPLVAASLNNLAKLFKAQGRHAEAEPLHMRALTIREKVLGPEHPSVATNLNNLAELYRDQGRYAEAEPLYSRSLANQREGARAGAPERRHRP